jgi:hypothetical protein
MLIRRNQAQWKEHRYCVLMPGGKFDPELVTDHTFLTQPTRKISQHIRTNLRTQRVRGYRLRSRRGITPKEWPRGLI